ncbi:MAG: OPT/YSL family transporter [Candidatus Babeliaceae bacterium]|nr:OPT/YSL family transporter [Candidatus Babeliaceae bacterium]
MITFPITLISTALFICFAVAVQSYVSMATPIGPWIEPIIALTMLLVTRASCLFCKKSATHTRTATLVTAAAGVGGAVAIAFGFSFPTLHFWDPALFASWLAHPGYLLLITGGATIAGGGFAFLLANYFESTMLNDPKTPFPIGEMVGRLLSVADSVRSSITLAIGFCSSMLLSIARWVWQLIPETLFLTSGGSWWLFKFPKITLQIDLILVFIAIGFIGGSILVVPLIVGVISKIFLLGPLHHLFFKHLSFGNTFLSAFAGGIILQEATISMAKLPGLIGKSIKSLKGWQRAKEALPRTDLLQVLWILLVIGIGIAYFSYLNFSLPSQIYLYLFTLICVSQAVVIGGKAGMAPMGRYATFVMLPSLFLFKHSYAQAMFISLFVWLVGMVTIDLLFGRVTARITGVERKSVIWFQLFGLIISALLVGIVFWLLIKTFGLGSAELCALRAQNRALLLTAWQLDISVLLIGALFGIILRALKINPILVFTGLFTPEQYSLLLIAGGLCALVVRNRQKWEPFWSGVFAAGSLWMLLKALLKTYVIFC